MDIYHISYPHERQKHHPDNIGGVVTFVLMLQALHDRYGFGRNRFHTIYDEFVKLIDAAQNSNTLHLHKILDSLVSIGVDVQMYHDFIRRLDRMVSNDETYWVVLGRRPIRGKKERTDMEDSARIVYILMLEILRKFFGFREKRLKFVQDKIKFYEQCISEKDVKLVEFMDCLARECDQGYGALDEYKAAGKDVS